MLSICIFFNKTMLIQSLRNYYRKGLLRLNKKFNNKKNRCTFILSKTNWNK